MRAGEMIDDRFEIERLSGSGGMGQVYRARDRLSGEPVAIKVLYDSTAPDVGRFAREAEVLAMLRHPGIVRYVGHGTTEGGAPYLAMEWLDGQTLAELLATRDLSPAEGVAFSARVAQSLGAIHRRGYVHRDVKPSNIFLRGGALSAPALIDFGIARRGEAMMELTAPGAMVGTPAYMAPEQARGESSIDARADVFSLGCVLFRCLTGRNPFTGDDALAVLLKIVLEEPPRLRELRPELPAALDDLVARMLAKSPDGRPPDGDAVAAEFGAIELMDAYSDRTSTPLTAPELMVSERRVMSLVVARPEISDTDVTLSRTEGEAQARSLRTVVARCQGQLEVLLDQSLLVVLTSAGAATDLAVRAARCGLALRALLAGAPVAIVSGRSALAARLPVGELIDRAVQLVGQAAGAQAIPIDEVTAGLLGPQFDVGSNGAEFALRGEREVFDTTRRLLGKPTSCVGRAPELGLLAAIYDQVVLDREAIAVVVTAPVGMGKSRLRYEFLRAQRARDDEAEIWLARGDPLGAGSAFGLLAQAIQRAFGLLPGEPIEARQRKLRARVARHLGDHRATVERIAVFLGELVGTPFPDEDNVQLRAARQDAVLMGDQMRRAWEDMLRAECQAQPVLLVLEDLHWGDVSTIKFIDAALSSLHDQRLMVLALARPEVHDLFPKLWEERSAQELRLRPLTNRASEQLARESLGSAVSAETIDSLVERANGNAFYLEELIRAVAEGKGAALPETVLAMVQSRLEGLDPEARRILRAASVFGQTFWASGVLSVLGGTPVQAQLSALTEQEVITYRSGGRFPGQDEYAFRHALVRESAYGMLTEQDRAAGHRLAGKWLSAVGEGDAMILAEHFERGGARRRAAACYLRAAEQALEGNDFDGAIARAEQGIGCGAAGSLFGQLRRAQADAHHWLGAFAESRAAGEEALRWLPPHSAPWYGAADRVGSAYHRLGEREQLLSLTEDLREHPPRPEAEEEHAIACARISILLMYRGRLDVAGSLLDELEARGAQRSSVIVAAKLHAARAWRALFHGDFAMFLRATDESMEQQERLGDLRTACTLRTNTGYAFALLGCYEDAERRLRDAIAAATRMGLKSSTPAGMSTLGFVLARLGAFEEARATAGAAIDALNAQGDHRLEGVSRIYLAMIFRCTGHLAEAEAEASRAIELLGATPPFQPYALATLADVLLARGRVPDALDCAARAVEQVRALGHVQDGEALVRLVYAEALEASRERAAARAAITEAQGRLLSQASAISDLALRQSFLSRVPENARTLQLARAWR
jgi:eukaryotic-like serine/threonine-protein kinase